jgi:two-component system sensor histidine kinase HydH
MRSVSPIRRARRARARERLRGDGGWRATRTALIIEFEPRSAEALRASASRALAAGGVAAVVLILAALGVVRWTLRRAARERQLEHERRLASLGQMSAVLSHEIRNPLASLKGNAQLLARSLAHDEKGHAKAQRVVAEAIRLESLTNDLLEFARSGEIHRADVDPATVLTEVARELESDREEGSRIQVVTSAAPSRWSLDADRIRQVLTNLLENALQAGEGEVVAEARLDGKNLLFRVRDHGAGIDEAHRERLFEPFYTQRTQGTGLGLAVCRRLVELHGGTITASNHPDGGAVFEVALPRR